MSEFPSQTPEALSEVEPIFQGLESEVTVPEKTLVEPYEGVHLRVEPGQEELPYFKPEAKIVKSLRPFLVALATARSVLGKPGSEDYYYWSQWVNVHSLPRFGGQNHLQFEVIGRNAMGDTWAQPVGYPKSEEFNSSPVVVGEVRAIREQLPGFMEEVKEEARAITLFDKPEAASQIEPAPKTVFQFQNYEIMVPTVNPHVEEGGLHLWVGSHMDKNAEGVQSDVKNGVEQFIIASAIAKSIYEEMGVPVEIHFSGNWGLIPKNEPGENWQEHLTAHANIYAKPPGAESYNYPQRPNYERPEIPEETRQKIKEALERHMSEYLNEFVNFNLGSLEETTHEA